ncbi:MAG: hypothetical protein LBF15_06275 [Candidatus Peribacteria bacterium]|nr:hypothetical protein [Candidatus Peribacteria bacterium]
MAVSTILNNPYTTNDIISVNLASGVNMLYNTADLSQDIRTDVNLKSN